MLLQRQAISFTIDETQLIFSDMLQVYRQDHNE
jgi:hypothetical protein